MALTDFLQSKLFKSKPADTGSIASGVSDTQLPPQSAGVEPNLREQTGQSGQEAMAQIQESLRQQKAQIVTLQQNLTALGRQKKELYDANKVLSKQFKEVKANEAEHMKYLAQRNLSPAQRQQLELNLKEIRGTLSQITDGQDNNNKIEREADRNIKELKRAVKLNEEAIRRNERTLKEMGKMQGQVQIQTKDIRELEKEMAVGIPDVGPDIPVEPQKPKEDLVLENPLLRKAFGLDDDDLQGSSPVQQIQDPIVNGQKPEAPVQQDEYWNEGQIS